MATIGRIRRVLSRKSRSGGRFGKINKAWLGLAGGGSCGVALYFLTEWPWSVKAFGGNNPEISPPRYPWAFNGVFKAFDHAALRRGWQVYRTVCHTCHSLKFVRFLDLVNVTHTAEEVKRIAAEFEVEDGPDERGDYYTRPGKLTDQIPSPYPNEEAARAANFGASPPDLTYMLYQGMIEYDDGTPASESQMAKDVAEFLTWTACSEHDTRKIMTIKCVGILLLLLVSVVQINRRNWSHVRSRHLAYLPNTLTGEPRHPTSSLVDEPYGRRNNLSLVLRDTLE
ncbi:Cytochrome c1, heme protein, mitochondrial [Melipona quadrifasciata]|uniref:Cytochrome c1, heme protein, mitochondrial n=1 Tax=Melipona quadrifasciata TaxID=166423 RepID=A0A0M9A897_9HYME|nr:Cytochrome c1, heme protein, mitochondrial [Melipona quadrifasciata]